MAAQYNKTIENMQSATTAVIYARYSSHAQRDVSIEQQVRACKVFAERQGIEIVKVYEDRALTGTNDRRPGFQKMVKDSERADWSYVIVYTLDRFARDRYDSAVYKRQLKNNGVKVLSAMENISDDPTGVLMESLLEGLAEYYSKELSRKILRGMVDNASKCMVIGALPLGYKKGADSRYEIDEAGATIIREIFRRVKDGDSLVGIIDDFNTRGLRTKTGKAWNKSSFNTILTNERYTGTYIYQDLRVPGGIPAIISKDLFDSVQCILQTKKNPRSTSPQRRRRENSVYLLTGKLFCGHCKNPMVGIAGTSRHGSMYYYYTCKGRRTDHNDCKKQPVRREYIEEVITSALKETMLTDKAISILANAAVEYQRKNGEFAEVEILDAKLKEINSAIKNIISAIEAGIFSPSTQNRLQELEAEQLTVSRQLTLAKEESEQMLTREEIIATLQLFQCGDIKDKAYQESLIDTFLVAAYLYDDNIKIVFNLGGTNEELSVPFNIDDVDLSSTDPSSVRIEDSSLHHEKRVFCLPDERLFFRTKCAYWRVK